MRPPRVLCCGSISHDVVVRPVAGVEWATTRWIDCPLEAVGGHGANTATALAVLGTPVQLIGMTGDDRGGEFLRARLRDSGVDIGRVGFARAATTASIVLVHPEGERASLNYPGAAAEVTADFVLASLDPSASRFHLATFFGLPSLRGDAARVLARAREMGMATSIDPNWDALGRWMEDLRPCLPYADILFLNESEAGRLTGEAQPEHAVRVLRGAGAKDVVVKLGPAGCLVFSGDEVHRAPGFAVETVDTTGAGDCFAGGFLSALRRGAAYPEAARFANAVGALCVGHSGATTGLRGRRETSQWIEEQNR